MTEEVSRSAPQLPPPSVSAIGAVGGVFTKPTATFEALVKRPTWWLPFVAGILLSAVFSVVMTDKIDTDAAMRQAFERRAARSGQTTSPAQMQEGIDRAVEMQRKLAPFAPTIGAAIFAFFFFLIALVLAGSGAAFGAEAKIPVYLSIYAYAQIPMLVRSAIALGRMFAAADTSLLYEDVGRLGAAGPAAFLSPHSTPPVLYAVASFADLFMLATVFLLVLAFRTLPGLSRRAATILPITLWGIMVLLSAGWHAVWG